jgi:adenylylsulfate kinase-like enzyme
MTEQPRAVLITGAYGTGKSTLAEELAWIFESRGESFAAMDLDWLCWAGVDDAHAPTSSRVLLRNLAAVAGNYRDAGMTRFIVAGTVEDRATVDGIREALAMPLSVVRLEASIEVIERRLATSPTSGRQDDLDAARVAIAEGRGGSVGDLVLDSDRPVGEVAAEVLAWLDWA